MIWRAFSTVGVVDLTFVSTKMNSAEYQDVLGHRLVPHLHCTTGQTRSEVENSVIKNLVSSVPERNSQVISRSSSCCCDLITYKIILRFMALADSGVYAKDRW
uniref:Uncharacterized protein n=1 Tax=Heterorhabditis bacteriophora TaxID=37862 RepID=A0A1I7WGF3_HETBA